MFKERIEALEIECDEEMEPQELDAIEHANNQIAIAAQIAQEADELISQLHDALNESMGWNWLDDETDPPDSVLDKCNSALDKYNQYKEANQ